MPRPTLRLGRPCPPRGARRLALVALAAVALASGCLHGVSPLPVALAPGPAVPAAEVRRALSVDGGLSPVRAASPETLAVVFGAPSGETTAASEVTLVFNKPMRKLGLSPHDPPPPVRLRPPVPGSWDWVGTSALRFTAATPLPGATAFQVEVPAGTRALDNSPLQEAYSLAFSTPRPALATSSPEAGEENVPPACRIDLSFSQPVSEAEVQRAVSLVARGAGAPLPFSVGRDPRNADRRQIQLTPRAPLPRGATLSVRIDASLHGEEGPLPAGKAAEITFRTIDPPRLLEVTCEKLESDPGACSSLSPLRWRARRCRGSSAPAIGSKRRS